MQGIEEGTLPSVYKVRFNSFQSTTLAAELQLQFQKIPARDIFDLIFLFLFISERPLAQAGNPSDVQMGDV